MNNNITPFLDSSKLNISVGEKHAADVNEDFYSPDIPQECSFNPYHIGVKYSLIVLRGEGWQCPHEIVNYIYAVKNYQENLTKWSSNPHPDRVSNPVFGQIRIQGSVTRTIGIFLFSYLWCQTSS